MIVGLGIDITELARMEAMYAKFGRRLLEKILTDAERAHLPAQLVAYLAGRFAAKEAAVKALGTGFSNGIGLKDIEIVKDDAGRPRLRLLGPAAGRAAALGVVSSHISITHDRSMAAAVVVLEA